ncbi:hypothetical protein [Leuconostoc mesenteroides]|uniref:hypothetical protein n=1 Tax=Leuconostoc mesenteroides TaxID=1245 RepID=UPI0011AA1FA1|nr:hypothetical protein [Leuconostoc mesenteroides]
MAYIKKDDIRKEVDELFSMYNYIFQNYPETNNFENNEIYITYDNHNHESRQAQALYELITGEYKESPVSNIILHTHGGSSNGDYSTVKKRKKGLDKYRQLKNELDFNDSNQAPKYAKQIVDSYK